jgi:hypothetical protein
VIKNTKVRYRSLDTVLCVLKFFEHIIEVGYYLNVSIACRTLFTMRVIVACQEKLFKTKNIGKNYLRSAITQERLNHLATIICY